jgi:hypothetical protein
VRKQVSGYNVRMEFFPSDLDVKRVLPSDTRLLDLRAEPYSNGKRLKVALELTPFQQRPYLDLTLTDITGEVIATTSIVEPVAWMLELNLHIRKTGPLNGGVYKLTVVLTYPDLGEVDRRDLLIEIPTSTV